MDGKNKLGWSLDRKCDLGVLDGVWPEWRQLKQLDRLVS